jgi:uracil phosphoribosyltransferase
MTMASMTAMTDQIIAGLASRDAHQKVGWYLAVEMLTRHSIIRTEISLFQHFQGTRTDGYRIFHEEDTLIVALMRGAEPMALGVSKAMPLAGFLHAKLPEDIMEEGNRHREPVVQHSTLTYQV